MLNQDANMIKYNKMINDFLYQLRETDGFKKFNDIDEAITDQNCKIEKFGFINGFIFAANLLGK